MDWRENAWKLEGSLTFFRFKHSGNLKYVQIIGILRCLIQLLGLEKINADLQEVLEQNTLNKN